METNVIARPARAGQVTRSAAEVYEQLFVPALFAEWSVRMIDFAGVAPGDDVLDVACGTGVLARQAARRVGETGTVTGIDLNEGMLAVAQRVAPEIAWLVGDAEHLLFADGSFDAALNQFGLMFFVEPSKALREMQRVVRPGGTLAVAVWDTLDASPGYSALADLLARLFGDAIADELRAPFALGQGTALRSLFAAADITGVDIRSVLGRATFPSLDAWLESELRGWTLADRIDDAEFAQLRDEAIDELARFVDTNGKVSFPIGAHMARVHTR